MEKNDTFYNDSTGIYSVGATFPITHFAKMKNYYMLDMLDDMLMLIVSFDRLNKAEIDLLQNSTTIEFRYLTGGNNYGILMCKFGKWIMELPFNPCLRREQIEYYINEKLNSLTIFGLDSTNGEIKAMRMIGLQHKVAENLHKQWAKMLEADFDKEDYTNWCKDFQARYNTKQCWAMGTRIGKFESLRTI